MIAVDRIGEELAELSGVDVERRERGLVRIGAGARVVVLPGEDVDLGGQRQRQHEWHQCRQQNSRAFDILL